MWRDLRFGLRSFGKDPGFTAVAVTALALGIGANATVFSLVNGILFKSLPFAGSERILYLNSVNPRNPGGPKGVSWADYQDLRGQLRSFTTLGASQRTRSNLSDDVTLPESYGGAMVTAGTLEVLGVRPLLGRGFEAGDERPGAPRVVVLGYALWEKRYGRDPSIVGRNIRVNSRPAAVVGVLPKGVLFPPESDFWQPYIPSGNEKRDERSLWVYGKLAPGSTRESAQAELQMAAGRLARQYPGTNRDVGFALRGFQDMALGGPVRGIFLVLLGAVGFVLLIACANVANLMLSRAVGRSREISIRAALGAGRWRVVRQLLAESLLLSIAGGLLGFAIAQWGIRVFDRAVVPTGKPSWIDFSMDYRALAYLAAISLATSVAFGLAPALRLSRLDLNAALKDGGRGAGTGIRGKYLSGALVVTETALAVVLLAGAGVMMRGLLAAYSRPTGIHTSDVLTLRFELPQGKYPEAAGQLAFDRQVLERLRALPGVEFAAAASALPASGAPDVDYETEGARGAGSRKSTGLTLVTDGYFETLGVTAQRGRVLAARDHDGSQRVAVINRTLAARAFPGKDPVGRHLRVFRADTAGAWTTVIGVVADLAPTAQHPEPDPMLYEPYRQESTFTRFTAVLSRTRVPPAALGNAFRREIQALDRDLPVHNIATMDELLAMERWPLRVFGTMFGIFAGIALLLATLGLYAVAANGVSRRTQEIGVRVALGASSASVLRMVFASGMRQAGIGLALGLTAAFGLTRLLRALLAGVSPTDPLTFGIVTGVLLLAAVLGCTVPARRAIRVDPAVALRHE